VEIPEGQTFVEVFKKFSNVSLNSGVKHCTVYHLMVKTFDGKINY
jgi:hypothetical protein